MNTDNPPLSVPCDGFRVPCPCCGVEIHVHTSPLELHDLREGWPYQVDQLPQRPDGSRLLTCESCLEDAALVASAGLPFDVELLREAHAAAERMRLPPEDAANLRAHVADLRRGAMRLAAADGAEVREASPIAHAAGPTDAECEMLVQAENQLLVECYQHAVQRREDRREARDRRQRRDALGLQVARDDDEADGLDF